MNNLGVRFAYHRLQ